MSSPLDAFKCMVTMVLGVALTGGALCVYLKYRRTLLRKMTKVGTVKDIITYPVASFKGIHGDAASCTKHGLTVNGVVDREFMVGQPSQTDGSIVPFYRRKMEEIRALFDGSSLILSATGVADIKCSIKQIDKVRQTMTKINCSGIEVTGLDCGDAIGEWLCNILQETRLRLYHCHHSQNEHVPVCQNTAYMLISESTVGEINKQFRLQPRLSIDRIRANIVISGSKALDETNWDMIHIGNGAILEAKTSIYRVIEEAYDEENLDWRHECYFRKPLNGAVCVPSSCKECEVGVYATVVDAGAISVGDPVFVVYQNSFLNSLFAP